MHNLYKTLPKKNKNKKSDDFYIQNLSNLESTS